MEVDEIPPPGEVIVSAFSPDGIYLACARDDNVTHVWDARFMGGKAQPCHILEHGPSKKENVYHDHNNGITSIAWASQYDASSPPLLATGGDDGEYTTSLPLIPALRFTLPVGMIRLWDMRKAMYHESQVLAELETNVGHFILGDIHKGEMPLLA
jgi:WD40 repeat protein